MFPLFGFLNIVMLVIIYALAFPSHLTCSRLRAVEWVASQLAIQTKVSMGSYVLYL